MSQAMRPFGLRHDITVWPMRACSTYPGTAVLDLDSTKSRRCSEVVPSHRSTPYALPPSLLEQFVNRSAARGAHTIKEEIVASCLDHDQATLLALQPHFARVRIVILFAVGSAC
jgi:hypothetical protein